MFEDAADGTGAPFRLHSLGPDLLTSETRAAWFRQIEADAASTPRSQTTSRSTFRPQKPLYNARSRHGPGRTRTCDLPIMSRQL